MNVNVLQDFYRTFTGLLQDFYRTFTGLLSRVVNCLAGFTSMVQIQLDDSMNIGNIIITIKNNLGKLYSVKKHKKLVKKELLEKGYSHNIINDWISHIE